MMVWKKGVLPVALVGLALLMAGCAGRNHDRYDGYYYGHRDHRWDDRLRSDRDDWRRNHKRVRVCDEDGSDCRWEYRER